MVQLFAYPPLNLPLEISNNAASFLRVIILGCIAAAAIASREFAGQSTLVTPFLEITGLILEWNSRSIRVNYS